MDNTLVASALHLVVSAVALLIVSRVAPGFEVRDFKAAIIAAIIIGVANAVLRPFLWFLTLPFTIITLGLFTFVLDAAMLKLCASLMEGFKVEGWVSTTIAAVLLAIVNAGLHSLFI